MFKKKNGIETWSNEESRKFKVVNTVLVEQIEVLALFIE